MNKNIWISSISRRFRAPGVKKPASLKSFISDCTAQHPEKCTHEDISISKPFPFEFTPSQHSGPYSYFFYAHQMYLRVAKMFRGGEARGQKQEIAWIIFRFLAHEFSPLHREKLKATRGGAFKVGVISESTAKENNIWLEDRAGYGGAQGERERKWGGGKGAQVALHVLKTPLIPGFGLFTCAFHLQLIAPNFQPPRASLAPSLPPRRAGLFASGKSPPSRCGAAPLCIHKCMTFPRPRSHRDPGAGHPYRCPIP